jgi:hypothetical protein
VREERERGRERERDRVKSRATHMRREAAVLRSMAFVLSIGACS